jgi:hypothetical protein
MDFIGAQAATMIQVAVERSFHFRFASLRLRMSPRQDHSVHGDVSTRRQKSVPGYKVLPIE